MTPTPPRCLDRSAAAEYCGLSVAGFSLWVAKGFVPGPLPGTRKWDRLALDAALDRMSGVASNSAPTSAYDVWKASKNARAA